MLTKLTIRNFKRFGEVEVELGNPVVFVGPNNSGRTPAMQALAFWDMDIKSSDEMKSLQARTLRKRAQGQQSTAGICLQFPIRVPAICSVICTSWTSGTLQNAHGQKTYGSKLWSPYAALSSAFVKVGEGNAISWLTYKSLWSVNWKQLEGPATQALR